MSLKGIENKERKKGFAWKTSAERGKKLIHGPPLEFKLFPSFSHPRRHNVCTCLYSPCILCIARQGKSVLVKAFYVNASRYSPRGKESLFGTSGGGESPRVCADDATFELYCNRAVNQFRDTFSFRKLIPE